MAKVILQFFGSFEAKKEQTPLIFQGRKGIALLSYLSLNEKAHSRTKLASMLWPDLVEKNARNNLRVALARLGKSLNDSHTTYFLSDSQTIRINKAVGVFIDVDSFNASIKASYQHEHDDRAECESCQLLLKEAVELYQGNFLEGFYLNNCENFEEWQLSLREHYQVETIKALSDLGSYYETCQQLTEAEYYTRKQIIIDPLSEVAHRRLMRLLSDQGKRNKAVEHFHSYQDSLQAELAIEPEDETVKLFHQIRTNILDKPKQEKNSPQVTKTPKHNLPQSLTPFMGRQEELERLKGHLAKHRLLTLQGIGGTGKTRLALALAESQLAVFDAGVFFIPLASVKSVSAIPRLVADALGFEFIQGSDSVTQLIEFAKDKAFLFIFDNAEHLADLGQFILHLLQGSSVLKFVVTSRQSLSVNGGAIYWVTGLTLTKTANHSDAVQLFLNSAERVQLERSYTEDDLASVQRICQTLHGHPLAIILAAGWLNSLSLKEIVEELHEGLSFLETDMQGVPERQRSIEATFRYSWRLLTPDEQRICSGLALFRSGFDRSAAKQVTGANLGQLTSLVNKSLVQFSASDGRYYLHELIKTFAQQKLDSEQKSTLAERHSAYYLGVFLESRQASHSPEAEKAIKRLKMELSNVQLAWQTALDTESWDKLRPFADLKHVFLAMRNHLAEASQMLQQAITSLTPESADTQKLMAYFYLELSVYLAHSGVFDKAHEANQKATALFHDLADPLGLTVAVKEQGELAWLVLDLPKATQCYEDALTLAREAKNDMMTATVMARLAFLENWLGHFKASKAHFEEALVLLQEQNDALGYVFTRSSYATLLVNLGEYLKAKAIFVESIPLIHSSGHLHFLPVVLFYLSDCHYELKEFNEAIACAHEGLELALSTANPDFETRMAISLNTSYLALIYQFVEPSKASLYLKQSLDFAVSLQHPLTLLVALLAWGSALREHNKSLAESILYFIMIQNDAPERLKSRCQAFLDSFAVGRPQNIKNKGVEELIQELQVYIDAHEI